MSDTHLIKGFAAPLNIANLDTDQIMPKQFLRGIDKKGLDKGVLWDLRFFGNGQMRTDFVLNKPKYCNTKILIAGPNFGCGSSREHAVWGLQQFGIQAVISSSFGEIFYSNAMNNGLVAVMLPQDAVEELLIDAVRENGPIQLEIDVDALMVKSSKATQPFTMSDRHRKMFLDGVDMIGASLAYENVITEFAQRHWSQQPWLKNVAIQTKLKLDQG